jgi:pSer/pThr/pTyr-binding forkhead associated (FHA) protein
MGDVAPIHAEIRMQHNIPSIRAVENGVFVDGKPIEVGHEVNLYHGTKFTIANTTFTYFEKDLA